MRLLRARERASPVLDVSVLSCLHPPVCRNDGNTKSPSVSGRSRTDEGYARRLCRIIGIRTYKRTYIFRIGQRQEIKRGGLKGDVRTSNFGRGAGGNFSPGIVSGFISSRSVELPSREEKEEEVWGSRHPRNILLPAVTGVQTPILAAIGAGPLPRATEFVVEGAGGELSEE